MKFNIVQAVPPKEDPAFAHTQCILEVAQVLQYGLEDLSHQVIFGNDLQKDCLNIILGYHPLWGNPLPDGYTCIVYQLEQLSEKRSWQADFLKTLRSASIVWDFSEQNVAFLRQNGIPAVYKPIGFHPMMQRIQPNPVQDVDVLFYGSINERRGKILAELQKKFNTRILFGVYGEERDQWISRSKMVLVVHYYDTKLFDEVRLTYLLNNRIFTVVENTPHKRYEDVIVYTDYENLVPTCERYLNDENARDAAAEQAFRTFSQYPESEFLQRALSESL
ncbi:MAG: hypothetical protein ACE5IR_25000 [bacterium]